MTQMTAGPSHLVVENELKRVNMTDKELSPVNRWPRGLTVARIPKKSKTSIRGQDIKLVSGGKTPSCVVKYKLLDGITQFVFSTAADIAGVL